MTATELRTCLKNELTTLFQTDYCYEKKINIYENELPKNKYEQDTKNVFPFILIEVENGEIPPDDSDEKSTCKINILVGSNLDDEKQPEVLSVVDKVILFLKSTLYIGKKYKLSSSIKWQAGKDKATPFEYGIIEMSFELPDIKKKGEVNNYV